MMACIDLDVVYKWYVESMVKNGRKAVASSVDVKKTYTWRFIKKFSAWIENKGLSERTARDLMNEVVRMTANRHSSDDKTLNYCLKKINDAIKMKAHEVAVLSESRRFIESRETNSVRLCDRTRTVPNVIFWYRAGHVSIEFLALSKKCLHAMSSLTEDERRALPSISKLNAIRISRLTDQQLIGTYERLLGEDLVRLKINLGRNDGIQKIRT